MSEVARVAGPIACVGLALVLAAPRRELRIAGLAAWALGATGLVLYLMPSGHAALLAAGGLAGLVLASALAYLFRRWAWLLPVLALACVPARFEITVGDTEASLLVPLYGVVAGAALALGYDLLRGDRRSRELGVVAYPLGALVAWTGLSLLWTDDLREGAVQLLAFYLPFGLLAVSIARLPWNRRWLLALTAELGALALLFAGIGVYQWAARDVFWNPKVIVANAYAPSEYFFRVNSVFWDPSIYGRFLVVAILVGLVVVLHETGRRAALVVAAVVAALWLGLVVSFSQSSFFALIVGVVLAAARVWRWRAAAAVGLVAVVLISVGFSSPRVRDSLRDGGLDRVTSDRSSLIANGARLALAHPVGGVGVGAFKRGYAERYDLPGKEPKTAASHNTPVTVAAETGLPGLALLAWLAVAAALVMLRSLGQTLAGWTALAAGLALAAIAAHSLFYAAFFEDPMTWGAMALAALAAHARATRKEVAA